MQKKTYVIPESELLLVRFEENFLGTDPTTSSFGDEKGYMIDKSGENWGY